MPNKYLKEYVESKNNKELNYNEILSKVKGGSVMNIFKIRFVKILATVGILAQQHLSFMGIRMGGNINDFTREQFEGARILKVSSLFKTHTPVSNRESIIQYNPDDTDLQKELVNSLSLMDSHWEKQNDTKDNDTGFIYTAKTVDEVRAKCNETGVDINYALHRWFNTQTSLTCEELFIKYGAVDEENTKDKLTDFYINGEQFDLKLTAYPTELKDVGIDPHTRAGKNKLIEWLYPF